MKTLDTLSHVLFGSALARFVTFLLPGREFYVFGPLVIVALLFWASIAVRLGIKIYRNARKAQADAQEAELKRLCVPLRGALLHHTGKPYDQLTDAEWNNGADENGYLSR